MQFGGYRVEKSWFNAYRFKDLASKRAGTWNVAGGGYELSLPIEPWASPRSSRRWM